MNILLNHYWCIFTLYKLFLNHILSTRIIPEYWVAGNIIAIYINKRDKILEKVIPQMPRYSI